MSSKNWVPEIMYEETQEEGFASHIPFIPVPESEIMPSILYIFESRETGEYEPGPTGEDLPVTEMDLHQYADLSVLKKNLDLNAYDEVRRALGLEPLREAVSKGEEISNNIRLNLGQVVVDEKTGMARKKVTI